MDVRLAADCARVAEQTGNGLDRQQHVLLAMCLVTARLQLAQRLHGEHGGPPCAKVLARELLARHVSHVVVEITGADALPLPIGVHVLKQLVTGEIAALLHHLRQAPVVDVDGVMLAALPAELETNCSAADAHMFVPHRRQPERLVLSRVLLVADPNEAALEQLHQRCQYLLARQSRPRQVGPRPASEDRQRLCERLHAIELGLVARGTPVRVIAVLLPLLRVATRRLEVAPWIGTDPHVRPRRRDRERTNAREDLLSPNHLPVRANVAESGARLEAPDTWPLIGDIAQPGQRGGLDRVKSWLRHVTEWCKTLARPRNAVIVQVHWPVPKDRPYAL